MISIDDAESKADHDARPALRTFAVVGLGLVLAVALLNLIVNPLGAYPWTVLRPLTWSARQTKVTLMSQVPPPDVLVLGSSRSMIVPKAEVDGALGPRTMFNASVDSAKAEDMYLVCEEGLAHGFHPSVVVMGVDLEAFYDPAETDIRTLANPALRSHLSADRQLAAYGTIGGTILSYTQIADSIRSVKTARAGYPKDKFRFDDTDGTFVWVERPAPVVPAEQNAGLNARFLAYRGLSTWRLAMFARTLSELRAHGARIYVYIPPMHPVLVEALRENPRYIDVHGKVVALLEAEKAKGGVVAFRDFTEISSFDGLADDFSDPLHINEENAARMTRTLLESR